MKKIIVFLFIFSVQLVAAQIQNGVEPVQAYVDEENNNIYNISGIERKPEFTGGLQKFYDFFNANFKLPEGEELNGKVFAMFIVEKDGTLTDIKVVRDIGFGTGKETIRVLKMSPKWNPGKQNGKIVRVMYTLPFAIKSENKMPTEKK